jgi:VIT1/CCC1 family predicted Fe2+/Mn2+ transporter
MASSRRHGDPRDAHLAETVSRLRTELDGLRRKQRSQAIIEQAKGLLAGRLHCSPDKAFEHLAGMSQHTNMKVIEGAAGLIGVAVPVTVSLIRPSAPHTDREQFPMATTTSTSMLTTLCLSALIPAPQVLLDPADARGSMSPPSALAEECDPG